MYGVKAHLCRSEHASCGQMKHVGPVRSPFQGDLGRWCRPTGSDAAAGPRQKPRWTLILQCMYVYVLYVCVCICMYAYVSVCIICICMYRMYLYVSWLYLYVWPRFSLNTLQSLQKAAWRGGTKRARLSTPLGMCPYHFAGILRPCP